MTPLICEPFNNNNINGIYDNSSYYPEYQKEGLQVYTEQIDQEMVHPYLEVRKKREQNITN